MNISSRFRKIQGVFLRQYWQLRRAPEKIFDLFFWAIVLDLITLGWMARWTGKDSPHFESDFRVFICCLVAWRVAWVGCYEFAIGFLDECWNRSLSNLVVSPLTPLEWFFGNMLVTAAKAIVVFFLCVVASQLLFNVSIAWYPLPCIAALFGLFLFGVTMGCLAIGIVLRFGIRAQFIGWSLPWVSAPLSGVFFPIEAIPLQLQKASLMLPSTRIMTFLRSFFLDPSSAPLYELAVGIGLSLTYLIVATTLLYFMYQRVRRSGFDHLE